MSNAVRQVKVKSRYRKKTNRQKKLTIRSILADKTKKIRLVFLASGLFFIFASFYLNNRAKQKTEPVLDEKTGELISVSFASEPVKIDEKFLIAKKATAKPKESPTRIVIPSLNINLPVRDAKIVNGYWEVFPDSAGFGLGSAYPEETGNTVIFAHARQGLFLPLKDIKQGESVLVLTSNAWYSYTVTQVKEVLPTQTEVIAPTENPLLTLYTCSGYADSKRLIVTAVKNPQ